MLWIAEWTRLALGRWSAFPYVWWFCWKEKTLKQLLAWCQSFWNALPFVTVSETLTLFWKVKVSFRDLDTILKSKDQFQRPWHLFWKVKVSFRPWHYFKAPGSWKWLWTAFSQIWLYTIWSAWTRSSSYFADRLIHRNVKGTIFCHYFVCGQNVQAWERECARLFNISYLTSPFWSAAVFGSVGKRTDHSAPPIFSKMLMFTNCKMLKVTVWFVKQYPLNKKMDEVDKSGNSLILEY